MVTLCEIRQEILAVLEKHGAMLVVIGESPDVSIHVEVCVEGGGVGSTSLY